MDNLRLFLFFALAIVLLLIYQAWVEDYGPTTAPPATATAPSEEVAPGPAVEGIPDVPPTAAPTTPSAGPLLPEAVDLAVADDGLIEVETDVLRVQISPRGGTVVSAWLKDYAVDPERPEEHVRLFKPQPPNMFIAQSGLLGSEPELLPTHEATFTASAQRYTLDPGQTSLTVELLWTHPSGVSVVKRYRFEQGSYLIHSTQEITNASETALAARDYTQLQRTELYDPNESAFIYTYTGGVYYSPEDKYKKVSFDDMRGKKLERGVTDGWIAMIQHYFLASWIPPSTLPQTFYTSVLPGDRYIIGKYSAPVSIPVGGTHSFDNRLFVGPKLQDTLASIAPGLDLAVDYGWLTILSQPIFWLLDKIHAVVGNWGWAIIILTILIKAAFYKLSETSYKSMANMRKLTPRMQALKDRYGDDKQRLNQAMMELYQKEKINPLGGCLPILIQIPVFIALYWVLLESVELRHAPFVLWIDNLSAPDPYFVLPLIMGVSMYVQQKLNPQPPDPIQAKVMMALPFVFTVFFAFFPAGLVLYWVVNNLLSIAQQWHITRNIDRAAAKAKG
jgi:YidC/Oxa1 family membrane protein insertase